MNKLMIVGGPTGVGKSEVAVRLALRYGGIIIGADSMQIYKGMDIGTGKITEEEKQGIPHTMIDIVQPDALYSVQNYCSDAKQHILAAQRQGRLPIVVGGTGLYIHSLLHEQNFGDAVPNEEIRKKYYAIYEQKGAQYLHDVLQKADDVAASAIAVNDIKRTIRALEIWETTGQSKSGAVTVQNASYDVRFYVLQSDRQTLYEKIDRRVDGMFSHGLIDEVLSLRPYWECRSMQAIGYKEIVTALKSDLDPVSAAEEIKRNSRRYAKRQETFLRWIQWDKTYVSDDFFTNIIQSADAWVDEK